MSEAELGAKCRSGCKTKDHRSWGACLRSARLMIEAVSLSNGTSREGMRYNANELERFYNVAASGIHPDGTTNAKILFAEEASEKFGAKYGTELHVVPTEVWGDKDKSLEQRYAPVYQRDIDKLNQEVGNDTTDMSTVIHEEGRRLYEERTGVKITNDQSSD